MPALRGSIGRLELPLLAHPDHRRRATLRTRRRQLRQRCRAAEENVINYRRFTQSPKIGESQSVMWV